MEIATQDKIISRAGAIGFEIEEFLKTLPVRDREAASVRIFGRLGTFEEEVERIMDEYDLSKDRDL